MNIKQRLSVFRKRVLANEFHNLRMESLKRIMKRRNESGLSCDDIQNEIDVELKIMSDLNSERAKVCKFLDHLNGIDFELMYAYYVVGLPSWEAVAETLHVCIRCVYKWRKRAFNTLEKYKEEFET